jgi:endonuclease YncB( thermonuclease family)
MQEGFMKLKAKKQNILFCLNLLLFCLPVIAMAAQWDGTVIRIENGATLIVRSGEKEIPVKLYGIDTQDRDQAHGNKAQNFIKKLAFNKKVEVRERGQNKNDDVIYADVYLRQGYKKWLNQELIKQGLAGASIENKKSSKLSYIENLSRQKKKGLWADPQAVSAWENRKAQGINDISKHAIKISRYEERTVEENTSFGTGRNNEHDISDSVIEIERRKLKNKIERLRDTIDTIRKSGYKSSNKSFKDIEIKDAEEKIKICENKIKLLEDSPQEYSRYYFNGDGEQRTKPTGIKHADAGRKDSIANKGIEVSSTQNSSLHFYTTRPTYDGSGDLLVYDSNTHSTGRLKDNGFGHYSGVVKGNAVQVNRPQWQD